jgi:hypothetical protein
MQRGGGKKKHEWNVSRSKQHIAIHTKDVGIIYNLFAGAEAVHALLLTSCE